LVGGHGGAAFDLEGGELVFEEGVDVVGEVAELDGEGIFVESGRRRRGGLFW
jgi:hypothetical protein